MLAAEARRRCRKRCMRGRQCSWRQRVPAAAICFPDCVISMPLPQTRISATGEMALFADDALKRLNEATDGAPQQVVDAVMEKVRSRWRC